MSVHERRAESRMRVAAALCVVTVACGSAPPPSTLDPCIEVRALAVRYEQVESDGLATLEKLAILAEQNPDCFSAEERVDYELLWRNIERLTDP